MLAPRAAPQPKGSTLSSLRVETLRLCWLEAFIEVAEEENISGAARELGIDQSTVSRYLQSLEKWLGKKLIVAGKAFDPQDARVSIGLTEDGLKFREIAARAVEDLKGFRTEKSKRDEIKAEMADMIHKMQVDARGRNMLAVAELVSENVKMFQEVLDACHDEVPLETIEVFHSRIRIFFAMYEVRKNRETRIKRRRKGGISGRDIDMSFLDVASPSPVS